MKFPARIFNPLFAFIGIQVLWVIVVITWIYWFAGKNQKLRSLAEVHRPELLTGIGDWFILTEGLVLMVLILVGVYVIFIFWRRQLAISRNYRNFISQVTHELKSPLASVQLHLETLQLRQPDPQKLASFIETMLEDTDRLNSTIENLLSANRFEQKNFNLHLQPVELSSFIETYLVNFRKSHRAEMEITTDFPSNIYAEIDPEPFATVLRNLLENAILYSPGVPVISMRLYSDKAGQHIEVKDRGKGIPLRDQKKVFTMFYRIRQAGEKVRGTGFGLFIVRSIIKHHNGKTWLFSEGTDTGTTFHILLPKPKVKHG